MSFKLNSIESLARQLSYAPKVKRLTQLAAAEELLLGVEPDTAYPLGYVVHAVTGYRPKHEDARAADDANPASLLAGVALQHDLGLLLETVSGEMNLAAFDPALGGEPVLGIPDVCARFGVTTKTIQRWRRRGLPARRFLFEDEKGRAKQRVGFRLSCVERFVANQDGAAGRPGGTDPLTADEQARVVAASRRLVNAGHDAREVVRRVARLAGRSSLAVRHTLERHDQLHAADPILSRAAEPMTDKESAAVLRRLEAGESPHKVAADLGRPRASVYRVHVESWAERIAAARVNFHDDPLYHDADPAEAERQVDAVVARAREAIAADSHDPSTTRPPRGLPPYLADLYRHPLLTPALERALFLRFNFHKCRFAALRGDLDPHLCRRRDLARLDRHLRLARQTKNEIVTANLRLVVSVARKHHRPGLDLMELVSDGNVVLMRAVEGFDVHRGFKFSTYATLALMKGFARSVPAMQAKQRDVRGLAVEPPTRDEGQRLVGARDELRTLMGHLDDRERRVLAARWELGEGADAEELGLSRQRMRQVEARAMDKLRRLATPT